MSFYWGDIPLAVIEQCHQHGVKVGQQVGTVADAVKCKEAGVDIIIAQVRSYSALGNFESQFLSGLILIHGFFFLQCGILSLTVSKSEWYEVQGYAQGCAEA